MGGKGDYPSAGGLPLVFQRLQVELSNRMLETIGIPWKFG
jgi:hypothetical protein